MPARERIVIDDSDVFGRLDVERVPVPPLQLMPVFVATGPGRGEWEQAREVEVQYLPPEARAA
jgi:hypothetical protein